MKTSLSPSCPSRPTRSLPWRLRNSRARYIRRALSSLTAMFFVCQLSMAATHAQNDVADAVEILAQPADHKPELLATSWKVAAEASFAELPKILLAMDDATPAGINWLTTGADAIVDRSLKQRAALQTEPIIAIAEETGHSAAARKSAYAVLQRVAPEKAEQWILTRIDDPLAEFRRPGVAQLLTKFEELKEEEDSDDQCLELLSKALTHARDSDQVSEIAKAMEELGQPVVLADHFGFVKSWYLIGPFDNADGSGYETVLEPEKLALESSELPMGIVDGQAKMETSLGATSWKPYSADSDSGNVDLQKALGPVEQGVGYGLAAIQMSNEKKVELRFRVQNSFKCWLNGELIIEQPIGHTGNFFDQYKVPVTLNEGTNLLLIKTCQTTPPQALDFFKIWHLGVRLSDETGAGLTFEQPELPATESSEAEDDQTRS